MSNVEIYVICEGRTEQTFVTEILSPYLSLKNRFLHAPLIGKPGHKGGNTKFNRFSKDVRALLKQQSTTYITSLIDYYGIDSEWPGLSDSKSHSQSKPLERANVINDATITEINKQLGQYDSDRRFLPYISMHEFEAILFSNPSILSDKLGVNQKQIDAILCDCGEPEAIDDGQDTAPSKRLIKLYERYKKTTNGIAIAKEIGIPAMRVQCPVFDNWLNQLEALTPIS